MIAGRGTPSAMTHPKHVQDIILMADSCDVCGYKSSEVKGGGAISERGRRLTLHVKEAIDLSRDVIKSETAYVRSSPFLSGCRTTRAKTRLQTHALTLHVSTFGLHVAA